MYVVNLASCRNNKMHPILHTQDSNKKLESQISIFQQPIRHQLTSAMIRSFGKVEFLADNSSKDHNIDRTIIICLVPSWTWINFALFEMFWMFMLLWDSWGKDPVTNCPLWSIVSGIDIFSCIMYFTVRKSTILWKATSCINVWMSQMKQPTPFSSVSGLSGDWSVSLVCIAMTTKSRWASG